MFGQGGHIISTTSAELKDVENVPLPPRRSQAIPNARGDKALYTITTPPSRNRCLSVETRVLDLRSNTSRLFTNKAGHREVRWLGIEDDVVWLKDADSEVTEIWIGGTSKDGQYPYCAGRIASRAFHLRTKPLQNEYKDIAIAVACPVNAHGGLLASSAHQSNLTTTQSQNAIWYTTLRLKAVDHLSKPTHYAVNPSRWTNALRGTSLASPISSCEGSPHDFDISSSGIVFLSQDDTGGSPNFPSINTYYIPLTSFSSSSPQPPPQLLSVRDHEGRSSMPLFSPSGTSLAFLKKKHPIDRNDRNRLIVVKRIQDFQEAAAHAEVEGSDMPVRTSKREWHLSPYSIAWAENGNELYAVAVDQGIRKLFKVPAALSTIEGEPQPVSSVDGTAGDIRHLRMVFSAPMDVSRH